MSVVEGSGRAELQWRVEALIADIAHCIDDDRLEELPGFFEPRGRYRVITRENHDLGLPLNLIYCDGADMLADRITALRTANIYEPHVYRHLISAVRVRAHPETGLEVWSNFTIIRTMAEGDASIFASGKYVDHVVGEGGGLGADVGLRLRERVAILDSRRIDTLLVIPV